MKKIITILLIIFIFSCSNEVAPISLPETIRVEETVIVEVTKIVEKIIYLDPTYNPDPTFTPTAVPIADAPWTPTPTPTNVPSWTPTAVPIANSPWTPTPTPMPDATWTPTPTPTQVPTWTPTPTPTATPVEWEFYLDGVLVTPTPIPDATWTPTPTPTQVPTWTPTPTPTALPPGDLGYILTSLTFFYNFTDVGEVVTIGITEDKSPIVDHNQNNDLTDEISTSDDNNYKILSVAHKIGETSEVTILSLMPVGNASITLTFYTTRK